MNSSNNNSMKIILMLLTCCCKVDKAIRSVLPSVPANPIFITHDCYFSLLKLFENILDFKYGIWSKVGCMPRMKRDRGTGPTCCCTMIVIRL